MQLEIRLLRSLWIKKQKCEKITSSSKVQKPPGSNVARMKPQGKMTKTNGPRDSNAIQGQESVPIFNNTAQTFCTQSGRVLPLSPSMYSGAVPFAPCSCPFPVNTIMEKTENAAKS